jgi:hypothetical protein
MFKKKLKLKDIISYENDIRWSKKQIKMIDGIQNEYDENLSLIWVSKNNEIIDGHHRYTILLNKFGGNYEITVRQFNVSKKTFSKIIVFLLPISLFILLPLYLIIEHFKFKKWLRKKENIDLTMK